MSIIKMTDWQPPNTGTFDDMQEFKQNPDGPYRELLMDSVMVEGEEVPVPYQFQGTIGAEPGFAVIRIPHALSIGSAPLATGWQTTPATVPHSRIPDVVIPIPVFDLEHRVAPNAAIALAWNTDTAVVPGSSTGGFADENYIYLAILTAALGGADVDIKFVVYVEYTHSMISNEIVTSNYYALAVQAL